MTTVTSSLIKIPSTSTESKFHEIHIRRSGSRPSPSAPVVIFISGLGSSCLTFSTVQRKLAEAGIFSLSYDRLGTGRSDSAPLQGSQSDQDAKTPIPRKATDLVEELRQVLQAANVQPPYILSSHSYGGVVAAEYLAAEPGNVKGLVFIDANSERSPERPVSDPDLGKILGASSGKFDYFAVVGLDSSHTLIPEEWDEIKGKKAPPEGWTKGQHGGHAEAIAYEQSCRDLARHQLKKKRAMGDWPVVVVKGDAERDLIRVMDEVDRLGAGSAEERAELRHKCEGYDVLDEEIQREQLQLTAPGKGRMVKSEKSGHYVHVTDPDLVLDEIKWAVEQLKLS